jgi:hypothetical protein
MFFTTVFHAEKLGFLICHVFLYSCVQATKIDSISTFFFKLSALIPEPTARSAVQGVNPGRRQGY